MKSELTQFITRRRAMIAGGVGATLTLFGVLRLFEPPKSLSPWKSEKTKSVEHLGDNFYLVDGWVVTADDINDTFKASTDS